MAHQAWDLHLSKSKASTFGTWDRTAGNVAGWEILEINGGFYDG